ncbi:MAG: sugar phosphate isomerase/epimerase, partial [Planctomycetes bacterium]|nr:sugar phosphate isomerase/epimerase [Planctomycetota bacterium]
MRRDTLDRFTKCMEQAAKLDVSCMVIHPGGTREPELRVKELDFLYEGLEELLEVSERTGVRIALENIVGHQSTRTAEALRSVMDDFDTDRLGVCFDSGHAHLVEDVCEAFRVLSDRVIAFHLHDNDGKGDQHLVPGEGTIDWPQFVDLILAARLDFPYCIEAPLVPEDDPEYTMRM